MRQSDWCKIHTLMRKSDCGKQHAILNANVKLLFFNLIVIITQTGFFIINNTSLRRSLHFDYICKTTLHMLNKVGLYG